MTDLLPPFLVLFVFGLSALSLVAISSLSSTLSVFCLFSGWHSPLDCHLQQLRVCKYLQVFLCFFQTHISFHKIFLAPLDRTDLVLYLELQIDLSFRRKKRFENPILGCQEIKQNSVSFNQYKVKAKQQ